MEDYQGREGPGKEPQSHYGPLVQLLIMTFDVPTKMHIADTVGGSKVSKGHEQRQSKVSRQRVEESLGFCQLFND